MDSTSKYRWIRKSLLIAILTGLMGACSNIDCPLDNQVVMTLSFFNSRSGEAVSISDSLSVYGLKEGKEEILFNRGVSLSSITLPLNQSSDHDTLLLVFHNDSERVTDTLYLQHSRQPHFEAIDCPASVFHRLITSQISVRTIASSLPTIDSVIISNSNVNYEDVENLKVFLRPSTQ